MVLGKNSLEPMKVLVDKCQSGLTKLGFGHKLEYQERLSQELSVINQLGFAGYFLTVGEVVDLTKQMGVRVAARGSGAGSLVNFTLGISGIDPVKYGLLMERFLSPLRSALPDIDLSLIHI